MTLATHDDFKDAAVLARLIERAEELERFIDGCKRKAAVLGEDVAQMRAVLVFHEQHGIGADEFLPHMSVRKLLKPSELFALCRKALKANGGCLDTRQLARHVIASKGMDADDAVLQRKIVFSVQAVMKTARQRGIVTDMGKRKGVVLWVLT